ncbi:MAG: zinc-binding dehydrogenase, partial [Planctomycetota bacterium]|nr:zinc-binding dehydrogenase [Planctomycetota bacterium]
MKQVLQNIRTGRTEVTEVPAPSVRPNHVLIQTRASLISSGSERTIVEFGRGSLLAKARSQPEKVRQVLDKIKTDGLVPTLEAVFGKLDEPMPLGYSSAGVVLEVGPGVTEFAPGDHVASNGPHAEIVCVPKNLCAKAPEGVTDEQAAFTVVSSVGLQGIRLLAPTLGEKFVVYGLGLIGLASVQLLRAHGCEVLGIDISEDRLKLAERWGAHVAHAGADPVVAAQSWTGGRGVDGVLIAASAQTDEIMHASAQMCRKRGRIVLVGVVGLGLRRSDLYEKEISFCVSCSYGPGRYDERYEAGGQDYPYGLV